MNKEIIIVLTYMLRFCFIFSILIFRLFNNKPTISLDQSLYSFSNAINILSKKEDLHLGKHIESRSSKTHFVWLEVKHI